MRRPPPDGRVGRLVGPDHRTLENRGPAPGPQLGGLPRPLRPRPAGLHRRGRRAGRRHPRRPLAPRVRRGVLRRPPPLPVLGRRPRGGPGARAAAEAGARPRRVFHPHLARRLLLVPPRADGHRAAHAGLLRPAGAHAPHEPRPVRLQHPRHPGHRDRADPGDGRVRRGHVLQPRPHALARVLQRVSPALLPAHRPRNPRPRDQGAGGHGRRRDLDDPLAAGGGDRRRVPAGAPGGGRPGQAARALPPAHHDGRLRQNDHVAGRGPDARGVRAPAPGDADGGFIPSVDHQTPPEVSLQNFQTYVRLFREYCGRAAR